MCPSPNPLARGIDSDHWEETGNDMPATLMTVAGVHWCHQWANFDDRKHSTDSLESPGDRG
jgi:hypothetical protein